MPKVDKTNENTWVFLISIKRKLWQFNWADMVQYVVFKDNKNGGLNAVKAIVKTI